MYLASARDRTTSQCLPRDDSDSESAAPWTLGVDAGHAAESPATITGAGGRKNRQWRCCQRLQVAPCRSYARSEAIGDSECCPGTVSGRGGGCDDFHGPEPISLDGHHPPSHHDHGRLIMTKGAHTSPGSLTGAPGPRQRVMRSCGFRCGRSPVVLVWAASGLIVAASGMTLSISAWATLQTGSVSWAVLVAVATQQPGSASSFSVLGYLQLVVALLAGVLIAGELLLLLPALAVYHCRMSKRVQRLQAPAVMSHDSESEEAGSESRVGTRAAIAAAVPGAAADSAASSEHHSGVKSQHDRHDGHCGDSKAVAESASPLLGRAAAHYSCYAWIARNSCLVLWLCIVGGHVDAVTADPPSSLSFAAVPAGLAALVLSQSIYCTVVLTTASRLADASSESLEPDAANASASARRQPSLLEAAGSLHHDDDMRPPARQRQRSAPHAAGTGLCHHVVDSAGSRTGQGMTAAPAATGSSTVSTMSSGGNGGGATHNTRTIRPSIPLPALRTLAAYRSPGAASARAQASHASGSNSRRCSGLGAESVGHDHSNGHAAAASAATSGTSATGRSASDGLCALDSGAASATGRTASDGQVPIADAEAHLSDGLEADGRSPSPSASMMVINGPAGVGDHHDASSSTSVHLRQPAAPEPIDSESVIELPAHLHPRQPSTPPSRSPATARDDSLREITIALTPAESTRMPGRDCSITCTRDGAVTLPGDNRRRSEGFHSDSHAQLPIDAQSEPSLDEESDTDGGNDSSLPDDHDDDMEPSAPPMSPQPVMLSQDHHDADRRITNRCAGIAAADISLSIAGGSPRRGIAQTAARAAACALTASSRLGDSATASRQTGSATVGSRGPEIFTTDFTGSLSSRGALSSSRAPDSESADRRLRPYPQTSADGGARSQPVFFPGHLHPAVAGFSPQAGRSPSAAPHQQYPLAASVGGLGSPDASVQIHPWTEALSPATPATAGAEGAVTGGVLSGRMRSQSVHPLLMSLEGPRSLASPGGFAPSQQLPLSGHPAIAAMNHDSYRDGSARPTAMLPPQQMYSPGSHGAAAVTAASGGQLQHSGTTRTGASYEAYYLSTAAANLNAAARAATPMVRHGSGGGGGRGGGGPGSSGGGGLASGEGGGPGSRDTAFIVTSERMPSFMFGASPTGAGAPTTVSRYDARHDTFSHAAAAAVAAARAGTPFPMRRGSAPGASSASGYAFGYSTSPGPGYGYPAGFPFPMTQGYGAAGSRHTTMSGPVSGMAGMTASSPQRSAVGAASMFVAGAPVSVRGGCTTRSPMHQHSAATGTARPSAGEGNNGSVAPHVCIPARTAPVSRLIHAETASESDTGATSEVNRRVDRHAVQPDHHDADAEDGPLPELDAEPAASGGAADLDCDPTPYRNSLKRRQLALGRAELGQARPSHEGVGACPQPDGSSLLRSRAESAPGFAVNMPTRINRRSNADDPGRQRSVCGAVAAAREGHGAAGSTSSSVTVATLDTEPLPASSVAVMPRPGRASYTCDVPLPELQVASPLRHAHAHGHGPGYEHSDRASAGSASSHRDALPSPRRQLDSFGAAQQAASLRSPSHGGCGIAALGSSSGRRGSSGAGLGVMMDAGIVTGIAPVVAEEDEVDDIEPTE